MIEAAHAPPEDQVGLTACLIVRDSARTLAPCLASIRPWVDELVVVDTGSLDNTREIAAAHGARVLEFPWCDDFSAARNESLRHAQGQWLFWMDSDDTIDEANSRKLRDLALGSHRADTLGYVMQVHCPGSDASADITVVDHVKLLRNMPELRFEFRIHEQLLPSIRRLGGQVEWTDIFVVHSGSDHSSEGRARKHVRDLHLLELELADRPEHPFALFNLGMTYADMDRHADAVGFLERALAASGPHESHVRKAYALLVGSLAQLGEHQRAMTVCEGSLLQFPDDSELLFRRGIVAHKLGRLEEAECSYRAALEPQSERVFTSRDQGITGFKARHNLALVYAEMQRPALAESQWREALADMPAFRAGWQGLGECLIGQKKLIAAQVEAERLTAEMALRPAGLLLEAQVALAREQTGEARELLHAAHEEFPADIDVLQMLCRLLFEHGPLDQACEHQQQMVALAPEDPAAHHNLGSVCLRQGQYEAAASSFRRSLKLRPDSPETQRQLLIAMNGEDVRKATTDADICVTNAMVGGTH